MRRCVVRVCVFAFVESNESMSRQTNSTLYICRSDREDGNRKGPQYVKRTKEYIYVNGKQKLVISLSKGKNRMILTFHHILIHE